MQRSVGRAGYPEYFTFLNTKAQKHAEPGEAHGYKELGGLGNVDSAVSSFLTACLDGPSAGWIGVKFSLKIQRPRTQEL